MSLKPFEIREALGADGKATEAYRRFHGRVQRGFHEDPGTRDVQDYQAQEYQHEGFVYRGYEETDPAPEWAGTTPRPVSTIVGFPRAMNVGAATIGTWAISGVGVASSHRRRGLLRTMMTEELQTAQREGFALSALTASEGGIYGRFGYGVSTRFCDYELDIRRRPQVLASALESTGAIRGSVLEAEPLKMLGLAEELAQRIVRIRPGQVNRLRTHIKDTLGIVDLHNNSIEVARNREAFVYSGVSGPEGFLVLEHQGYESDPPRAKIVDFQAATSAASVGLWNHLFTVDLLDVVDFKDAPGMALSSILQDPRAVRSKGEADLIWTRILDVVKVLEARYYGRDGEIVLLVDDPLGLITGAYALEIRNGAAKVTPADGLGTPGQRGDHAKDDCALSPSAARVRFPADRLASAVFRGCALEAQYGVVLGEGAEEAAEMFAVKSEPYCDFGF
ncbi:MULTISPECIES: GNAT family N-acetyltransferase [Micrococcaceae]|uniref:GNAT family N-acetyltransferase n=1 Tax=unclassified Kocuria TaxID=2649579 RepID=UPI001012C546|nr:MULTISPECIES: GNAT family N-acetyltransferase [unclassified Kocuria]